MTRRHASTSPALTRSPAPPTTSRNAPSSLAITGTPDAIASTATRPNCSTHLGVRNDGTATLTGKAEIRKFFETKAAPFQPVNHSLSDTPAYKIRTTVNGDKGTLYFECHYIDTKTQKVAAVVGADQNVQKINGKWLIVSSAAATPILRP